MNGVRKRNRVAFTIDSLEIHSDTAFAIVSLHVDRMTLRADDLMHHVETRVTQREAWVRCASSMAAPTCWRRARSTFTTRTGGGTRAG